MSKKQLSVNEWLYFFDLYEKDYLRFKFEYGNRIGKTTYYSLRWFKYKYKLFLYNNDVMILKSKTGKSKKKNKGVGRPKKTYNKRSIISEIDENIKIDIIERYLEIIEESQTEKDKKIIEKIIQDKKISSRKLENIVPYSKSHICRKRNGTIFIEQKIIKKPIIFDLIENIFYQYKKRFGRKPISKILEKEYGIIMSDRHVGRIMNRIGLFCVVRKKRKIREIKNTKVLIKDIVNRDFDNQNHIETILATDVTFLQSPKDVLQNHIYLSATINHKTKQIVSYKLSKNNDTKLIIDSIKDISIKDAIIHSDHGSIYSSQEFLKLINEKKWKQSMSRIGNSLDNREIEYWFSILKTELVYQINMNKITYHEFSKIIDEYIYFYNNFRIQEKLNWCPPNNILIDV